MNWKISLYLGLFFLSGLAIGLWAGQMTSRTEVSGFDDYRPALEDEVDHFYTDILQISDVQRTRIKEIDGGYRLRRDHYAARMHKANLQLAEVLELDGYESELIVPLVAEIHKAMGDLQALSLSHLAEIDKVLTPDQAARLKERAVARLRQN